MREYVLVCLVAAVVTFVTTPLVRAAAVRFGAVTPVRSRDVHSVPIPRLGGAAMLLGFLAAVLVASRLPHLSQQFDLDGNGVAIGGIVAAAVLTCGLGALDDFRELDALTKFAGQVLAAGAMVVAGVQLVSLPLGGASTVLPRPVLIALTIFIVVATTNAVNFVDGLDGLAAGVVAIAGTTFFVWTYVKQPHFDPTASVFSVASLVTAVLVGVCLGFLPHNFHPARLFMGDSGALLLGLLLAAATISFTGQFPDPGQAHTASTVSLWLPIALPVAVLAMPVLDVVLAIIRRRGNFHQADSKHLHHKMLRIGHTHRRAVLILYLWSASVAIGVLSFAYVSEGVAASLLAALLLLSLVCTWGVPRWSRLGRL